MNVKRCMGVEILLLLFTSLSLSNSSLAADSNDLKPSILYGYKEKGKNKAIYLSDAQGKKRYKVVGATLSDGYPAMSPSGERIAFYGKYDDYRTWSIHTVDIDGKNVKRLTHVKHVWDSAPVWSPDGRSIAFAREYKDSDGNWHEEIWLMDPDGNNKRQIKALQGRSPEFMQDGRLLFQSKASPSQISIANIDGSNVIQLTDDETNNMSPKISPDGKQIAYLSNRDGNQEVYVMDLDGSNQMRLTKNDIQEWDPAWSPDGSKVYFSSQNVLGFYDIFRVNKDGTSAENILSNASQGATVYHVDNEYLQRLIDKSK
ncbi:TolB family protein [Agaribacter flavus]|uniref:TolB family protein n=1 Tax=Agaribacter flavus TaxID=1902781 RepID=A0ABV7FNG6_9ALTE